MLASLGKTLLMYGAILTAVRLMGKRQISQLQTSELVVTLLISELAALPIQGPVSYTHLSRSLRSLYRFTFTGWGFCSWAAACSFSRCSRSVSYTHLDVYKRQSSTCPSGASASAR